MDKENPVNSVESTFIQKLSDYWWLVVLGSIAIGEGVFHSDGLTLLGIAGGFTLGIIAQPPGTESAE